MEFKNFANQITNQFNMMSQHDLFTVELTGDQCWDIYLLAFPEGTNNLYLERNEYDCQMCRQFIRNIANVVSIIDGEVVSIWDIEAEGYYNDVAKALSNAVKASPISSIFLKNENRYGLSKTLQQLPDNKVLTWNHFHADIPAKFFKPGDVASLIGKANTQVQLFQRGLETLSVSSAETILELIAQGSIYRGSEFKDSITGFVELSNKYEVLHSQSQNAFLWTNYKLKGALIRNSAIGSLLQDLSEGKELEGSVKSFEAKVAPANYKRTKALVTPGMIKTAIKTIADLGIEESLPRRYAHIEDVSVNNVLFVDRSVAPKMKNALESMLMAKTVKKNTQNFDKVEEISIDNFLSDVLHKVDSIEVLLKNSNVTNLMSIVAPVNSDAPNILKWDNNFSWTYNGDLTDSGMKQRVKAAGGRVDGVFRFTHSWNELEPNISLMDLHVLFPENINHKDGKHDNYGTHSRVGWNRRMEPKTGGTQDVDYTAQAPTGYVPIENITFPNITTMPEGTYTCKIHNWDFRGSGGRGKAEIEFGDELYQYEYPATTHKEWVTVAKVTLKNGEFTIEHVLKPSTLSKEVWNIPTEEFHKVSSIMLSPNHWDNNAEGNKHTFFIIDDCKNPEETRGMYNEFLISSLTPHRKVFDLLATQMKCAQSDNQLSGLGFSSTVRNELIVKVSGSFTRMLKIKF